MSPYLEKAFISIEDERFEEHHGVDLKRTLGAFVTFITHSGESSFGGSTITQQVVKNLLDERDDSGIAGALRKIKEMSRAYQVEDMLSKSQIIELYLNLIPLGGKGANANIHGVQVASRYYFNKNANEITISQAAYLAGITSAPSTYDPFDEKNDRTERINNKVRVVLRKMYELGKINEEEYNIGLAEVEAGIKFEKGEIVQKNKLNYYLEAAIAQIKQDLMEKNNWTEQEAKMHLEGDGYQIYTAFNPDIQKEVDAQFVDNAKKWYVVVKVTREVNGEKVTLDEQRQGSIVIIDNETGYVVAGAGGLGEKTTADGTNRMYATRHNPGSCIKPIAVVGPSLEEGLITLGSVVDDTPVKYGNYTPHNWYSGYYGLMGMREILGRSTNIPEVKLIKELGVANSLKYLDKLGVKVEGEENDGLSLALGGMTYGMSTIEMAAAYAAIQNGGVYREPKYYSKITDKAGNLVMEADQKETRVFSEQNAWLLTDLMKEPIYAAYGTGGRARISGQEVRGKTGTTNGNTAAWFCGFTKYYTGAVWLGFDYENEGKNRTADSGICANLWQLIMTQVHKGKEKKAWDQPRGITTATICQSSGMLATDLCRADPEGNKAITEYFATGTQPNKYCTTHVKVAVCEKTNLLAGDNCEKKVERVFITRPNADKDGAWKSTSDAKYMAPTKKCEECKAVVKPPETNTTNTNTTAKPNTNTTNTNTTAKPNTNTTTKPNTNTTTKPNTNTTSTNTTVKPNTNTVVH